MGGFHIDFRPDKLDELWGNEETVAILKNMFVKESHPQTFLFYGESGCGKTTTARACANELGIEDVMELNISDARNIDDARALLSSLDYFPFTGRRVYILDECHKANDFWSDSMLKALEEPPSWAYFFLCTTEPAKLKKTIRKRCSEFKFGPIPGRQMNQKIVDFFNTHVGGRLSDEHRMDIVDLGAGVPRDTLQILGKVMAVDDDKQRDAILDEFKVEDEYENLGKALLDKNLRNALAACKANKARGHETIRQGILAYMGKVMEGGNERTLEQAYNVYTAFKDPFFNNGWSNLIYACVDAIYGG